MDAPIQSDKWINLYFDKSGKSYTTGTTWSSEEKAFEKIEEDLARHEKLQKDNPHKK